jgi:hypothetical protein
VAITLFTQILGTLFKTFTRDTGERIGKSYFLKILGVLDGIFFFHVRGRVWVFVDAVYLQAVTDVCVLGLMIVMLLSGTSIVTG